ncbi:MAG: tRNA uridine-5-carboxymethylaminomethyl(34) synthesis GTPase MnmE [Nitrospirae bacterium]|nr:tRNA uridine-5-carboxymethylaminomethyl(34) synthesis GTPase MnmE [Nitrospirota bacterium]
MSLDDTIAAISTPIGEGGIGIVRLSGKDVLRIAGRIFSPARLQTQDSRLKTHTIHYGHIVDPESGNVIDEVLLTFMKAPATYTREDVVEINCHGGIVPLKNVLELCLKEGARLADPGEFTKRAFLNGRIDLTQAEAVIDIIKAKTDRSLKAAMDQLRGSLSLRLNQIRDKLINLTAYIEAHIDFPDEEIDIPSREWVETELTGIIIEINDLIRSSDEGKVLREGISTAIIGRPNVGKSSLLNALLMEDRAIVTEIPGTTRDIIEEFINIDGIALKIVDTAGIRKAKGLAEEEGVRRSLRAIDGADLILLVLDGSQVLKEEDRTLFEKVKGRQGVIVLNKNDLPPKIEEDDLSKVIGEKPLVKISATEMTGIEELRKEISNLIFNGKVNSQEGAIITKLRHKKNLLDAKENLENFRDLLAEGQSSEFLALDLREALDHIGEIVGIVTTEDILDRIFSEFCIGK